MAEEKKLLEDLANSEALMQLETLLAEFNIFEAMGAVRQELRHSDFLAFLLDPRQSHGLGDAFLKSLLKTVLDGLDDPFDNTAIDALNLGATFVQRERHRIDILILNEAEKFVCVIENKIDSFEHSDQLATYYQIVTREYPGFKTLLVFLTPDGLEPSNENYLPLNYAQVAGAIETVYLAHRAALNPEVSVLIAHYLKMLRRHIVTNSEIATLCRRIYREHQAALDLIFENKPDSQVELREFIQTLLNETKGQEFYLLGITKSYIEFIPREWATNKPLLVFGFNNAADALSLRLYVNRYAPKRDQQNAYRLVSEHPKVFRGVHRKGKAIRRVLNIPILTPQDFEESDLEELKTKIQDEWDRFLTRDLPAIQKAVKDLPVTRSGWRLF